MAMDVPERSYLIVASLPEAMSARVATGRIKSYIRSMAPKGAFSVTVNRQQGFVLLCAFELQEDADRMAAALDAKPVDRYGGWKSQRAFSLYAKSGRIDRARKRRRADDGARAYLSPN